VGQENEGQISLVLSAPVYAIAPETEQLQLRYTLTVRWELPLERNAIKGSLTGSTVVIDEARTILAHPNGERVGRNVNQEKDASRLESIIKNALAGNQDFIHLFSFETNTAEEFSLKEKNLFSEIGRILNNLKKDLSLLLRLRLSEEDELLAGYAATSNPIATDNNNRWVILAVTPLEYALSGLEEIQQVLLNLIVGLIATSIIAAIYLARTLADPLEKLRDYAVSVNDLDSPQQVPQNLKIQEFNQLAEALNKMVERLKSWAEELEKASQEANIANELKSEFLTKISHELRTPLNGIIGSIQLILDGFCDDREEEIEYLQQGHDSAMHLWQIVNDILDLRKIESGAMSMLLEDTNLTEILFEAIAEEEETIVAKGLELNKPFLSEAIFVDAEPEKLKQVFLNVLSNAIKFTEKGSITIFVEVDPVPNNNDLVKVKVEDTGIGIDMTVPESKGKIFEAFQAIDAGKTKKFGGVGLGLTIALHLIEAMRGSIEIESHGIDKGTLVTVTLPVKNLPPSVNGKEAPKETTVDTYSS
jgi:signal transduction histidine kinase